jgi:rRNA maturation protein Nop10
LIVCPLCGADAAGTLPQDFYVDTQLAAHIVDTHMKQDQFSKERVCWCGHRDLFWSMLEHCTDCGGVVSHYLAFNLA